jgi:ribosomal protein L7/L12
MGTYMAQWVIGIAVLIMFAVVIAASMLQVRSARRSGLLPPPGQATMADVERLAKSRQLVWAIRCYREIHRCGLAEAKRAVETLYPVA